MRERVKILVLTKVFPPHVGGSGRWLWELYRRFPTSDVIIAAGEHPDQLEFDHTHDLNVVRMPLAMSNLGVASWGGLKRYAHLYRRASRLIRQHDIDQIHCGTILSEGWIAWLLHRRFGIPYVCYVHGEEMAYIRQSREMTWMARRVLGAARAVIVNSHNTARVLRDDWSVMPGRLTIMYPGVDIDRFVPADSDPAVRLRLGWENRKVVLTVGRLQTRKGHDHLIQALIQVRRHLPSVLYSIVGDGPRREHLECLVREHELENYVQFRGDLNDDELIHCYQQCDLFALPNREVDGDFEGFGMVLVEAQACGQPVLAGTSGGTGETMRIGETGRLVDCNRPERLAAALVSMLRDQAEREQMGLAARHWVVDHFDWRVLTEQASKLFQSLAEPSSTAATERDEAEFESEHTLTAEAQESSVGVANRA